MFKSHYLEKKKLIKHVDEEMDSRFLDLQLRLKKVHVQLIEIGRGIYYLEEFFKNYKEIINYQYDKDSEINNNFQALIVTKFMKSPLARFVWDNASYKEEYSPFFMIQIEASEQCLKDLNQIKEEYITFSNDMLKQDKYKNYSLGHSDFLEQLKEVTDKNKRFLKFIKQQEISKYFEIIKELLKKQEIKGAETKIELNIKAHINKSTKAKLKKINDIESGIATGKFYFIIENILPSLLRFLHKSVSHKELEFLFENMIEVLKVIHLTIKKYRAYLKDPIFERKELFFEEMNQLPTVLSNFMVGIKNSLLQFQYAKKLVLNQLENLVAELSHEGFFNQEESYNEIIRGLRVIVDRNKMELIPVNILKFKHHLFFCGDHILNHFIFLRGLGKEVKLELHARKSKLKEEKKIHVIEQIIQLIDGISANADIICGDGIIRYLDASFKNHFRSIDKIENTKMLPNVKNLQVYLKHIKKLYLILELYDDAFTLDDLTDLAHLYKMDSNTAKSIDLRIEHYSQIRNSIFPFISEIYFGFPVLLEKNNVVSKCPPLDPLMNNEANPNEKKKKSKLEVDTIIPEVNLDHSFTLPRSQTSPGRALKLPEKSECKEPNITDAVSCHRSDSDKRRIYAGIRTFSLRALPKIKSNSENSEKPDQSDIDAPTKLKRNNNF